MTPNDIFAAAAAYLSETPEDCAAAAPFVPEWLSVLLAEALPVENALRVREGAPALPEAPHLTAAALDTPLSWHAALERVALPYGLAADLARDDDSETRCRDFRARYLGALTEALAVRQEPVADLY